MDGGGKLRKKYRGGEKEWALATRLFGGPGIGKEFPSRNEEGEVQKKIRKRKQANPKDD